MSDELAYFNDHVWRIEDKAIMLSIKDHVFVWSRWVVRDKGEHRVPDTTGVCLTYVLLVIRDNRVIVCIFKQMLIE